MGLRNISGRGDNMSCLSRVGVQKERMVAEDMYVMSAEGKVISAPVAKPWPHKHPKCSDCAPLFMKVVMFPLFYVFYCFRFLYVWSNFLDVFTVLSNARSWSCDS